MHLSSLERYEIQAEAFRRMTGHLAPGKDAAAGTYDEAANRTEIYARWAELHGECVYAMLDAVDYVLRTAEDDEADDVVALDAAQRDAERSAERDAEMRADAFGEKP